MTKEEITLIKQEIKRNIIKYGFHIHYDLNDVGKPQYAYTVGLWKTFDHPEIILFGLPEPSLKHHFEAILSYINYNNSFAIDTNITVNEQSFCIKKVLKAHMHYFVWSNWYNSYESYPAVQLFWSDLNNKMPWDKDFAYELKTYQPLLHKTIAFNTNANYNVFTSMRILKNKAPMLYISHYDENDWEISSLERNNPLDLVFTNFENIIRIDPSINSLFYLMTGKEAERISKTEPWITDDLPNNR